MKYYFILFIALTFVACTDSKTKQFNAIKTLEQSDKIGTSEGLAELADLHKNYGMAYSDSVANGYLYAAAMHYYFNEDYGQSNQLMSTFTTRGDSSIRQRNAFCLLANIAHKTNQWDSIDYWIDQVISDYKLTTQQWSEVKDMYNDKIATGSASASDFEKLSKSYWALGHYPETLKTLDTAIQNFPSDPIVSRLVYRAGFVSWEYLEDPVRAASYYRMYITQNPEGEYAEEVETILASGMLDMTDDAILEMLKAKS